MPEKTLKPGWKWVKFGDVVRQVKEKADVKSSGLTRYVAGEHMDTDDLLIRRWGEIGSDYLGPAFHMRFKPGQVLYGSRRTYLRKVAVADFDGICANTTYVLETKDSDVLLQELLPYVMSTEAFHEHSIKQSKGSVNPYINFSDIEWYEFTLPPLEEQIQFVFILDAIEGLLTEQKRVIDKVENIRQAIGGALIKNQYSRGLLLNEIASFSSGKSIKASMLPSSPEDDHTIPVIGGNGIAGYTNSALTLIPKPVVVVGRVGAYCGVVHFIDEPCWVTDNALFLHNLDSDFYPKFIAICLEAMNLNRVSVGGAQPLINQHILGNVRIPEISLDEQLYWITIYDSTIDAKNYNISRFNLVNSIKRTILNKVS